MSLKSLLQKMAFLLERKPDSVFFTDVKMQLDYVGHFREPVDDIERSYFQYKCKMKLYGTVMSVLLNIASFPLTCYYLLKIKRASDAPPPKAGCAVFFRDGKPANILPECVREQYPDIIDTPETGEELTKADRLFIRELIRRYPFAWHFALKVLLKIALYRSVIGKYTPSALIGCCEYSFTSSAMTEFCRRQGIKLINVMHGEKLLYMREAFFHFDECYVWSSEYVNLFETLRAEKSQFHIAVPPSLLFSKQGNTKQEFDYTYYLAAEDDQVLQKISELLRRLAAKGCKIAVRPHPRYSVMSSVEKYFSGFEIEDFRKLTIEDSVLRTRNAVSLYSTVLNQAYHNGVDIVIDDISNRKYYERLVELRYSLLAAKHRLLSEILAC